MSQCRCNSSKIRTKWDEECHRYSKVAVILNSNIHYLPRVWTRLSITPPTWRSPFTRNLHSSCKSVTKIVSSHEPSTLPASATKAIFTFGNPKFQEHSPVQVYAQIETSLRTLATARTQKMMSTSLYDFTPGKLNPSEYSPLEKRHSRAMSMMQSELVEHSQNRPQTPVSTTTVFSSNFTQQKPMAMVLKEVVKSRLGLATLSVEHWRTCAFHSPLPHLGHDLAVSAAAKIWHSVAPSNLSRTPHTAHE